MDTPLNHVREILSSQTRYRWTVHNYVFLYLSDILICTYILYSVILVNLSIWRPFRRDYNAQIYFCTPGYLILWTVINSVFIWYIVHSHILVNSLIWRPFRGDYTPVHISYSVTLTLTPGSNSVFIWYILYTVTQ